MSAIEELPDYMKLLYRAKLDVYEELNKELSKEGRSYGVEYSKEAVRLDYSITLKL